MHIKRLTLTLPARFKHSAHLDAKKIAQAIALQLTSQRPDADQSLNIALTDQGQSSASLAQQAAGQVAAQTKGNG